MMKHLRFLFTGLFLMLGSSLIMAQGGWNPDNPPEPAAKYKITVSSSPNYAYTSGSGWYSTGQQVWIYSSSYSADYKFKYWTKNGEKYSEQNSFNYKVESSNENFVAVYEYDPQSPAEPDGTVSYHLYLNTDMTGSCSFSRTSGAKVKAGDYVYVTVYVNQGYKFLGWYIGEDKVGETTNYNLQMPANDVTLTAHMEYSPENPADPESPPDQPVTIKIKAKDKERLYGDANPAFEYVTNTDISGTPVLTCEADEKSPVGNYTIVVDRGSVEGEDIATVNGTLTVKKASLKIQGKEYTIKQGEDLPNFDLDYIGFKNDDTKDCLTTQPTVTCTATKDSPEGEYEVTVTGGEAQNYDISCTNGKLIITKAETEDPGDENRKIVNLSIGSSGSYVDKTRVVFNESASLSYETERDAAKIISNEADYQIYTLDASNVKYSINERPADNGNVTLGIVVKNAGSVSIAATRMDCPVVLVDKTQNVEYDFANGDYTFNCDAGTYENRFYIKKVVPQSDAVTITAKSYSRTYGEDNPTFEYTTTGATLNGTPEISCEATKASNVGTYTITLSKGSVTNNDVTLVNGTLSITKATIKASVGEYTITEGDDIPTFTISYDGFKNNETAEVFTVVPVSACSATKESKAGEYEITISGGEATNYEFSYTAGKLVILEPLMTITAKNYSRTYGEDNPAFEYTTTGGTLNGTPEISCEATKASNVGTYTITLSKGNVTNGNVTLVNGTLTITQAPLKVSVGEYTITEGDDIPSFTISYDGFKNNETADVLTTKPMAKCDATKESKAGEYEITVSGGEATNYSFSYTSGKLIIEAAPSPEPEGTTFDENVGDSSSDENQVTFIVRNSDNGDTPTVAIFDDKDVTGEFDIPETVIYNNVNYIVKEIAAGAFQNNIGLTAVSIPESIASIGEKAFAGCTSLQSITVYITKPINLSAANARRLTRTDGSSVFEGVDKETCILYVPEGSVDLYKAAPVWKEFKNILAIGTSTGVKTILNADGKPFDIYDLNGRIVKAKTTSTYGLPKGVYIIDRKKVVVD